MARTPPENGAEPDGAAAETDHVLLTRFVRRGDEAAFTEIVRRHSDLVFGVCVRTLRDRQAAEDAFQATFLVLARSAGKIRRRTSLGSWLHGVACRISLRALAKRHRRRETCSPMNTITTEPTLQDVGEIYEQQLLDAELRELPEKYREPLVLHYLQGLSNQQVADRLDVSVSCVEGRLKRGKKELRLRLTRRGIELGAALTAVHLTTAAAKAGALESLITSTAHIAASHTLTSSTAAAAPSEAASQLAAKEIAMLATTKTGIILTTAATAVIAMGVIAGLNSSQGIARAENPPGGPGTTLETTIDLATSPSPEGIELAQSPAPAADQAAGTTADLLRTIQDLRDRLKILEEELDARSAQNQSDRVSHDAIVEELNATIARQRAAMDQLRAELDSGSEPAVAVAANESAATVEENEFWDFQTRDPQTRQIMAALGMSTTIEFPSNPLSDVVDYISLSHDIPILLDETLISEVGVTPDEEVSLVLSGVTLKNALEIMLNKLDLDYVVENQVLKITSREHADSVMETRVYSLNQLPADYKPEDIARVIVRTIAPETWRNSVVEGWVMEEGGEAMMAGMSGYGGAESGMREVVEPAGGHGTGSVEHLPGVLVVTQSQRVHREIVDLLTQLKRQYEAAGAAAGEFGMEGMYGSSGYGDFGARFGTSGDSGAEFGASDAEFEEGAAGFDNYGEGGR